MFGFIKKYSSVITILLFAIAFILMVTTNQYDLASKDLSQVVEKHIEQKTIWYLSNQSLFLNTLATITLNIAIALFISTYFMRYIEKEEKESFYTKLEEFQKNTAKDAILSTFNRVIDNDLFKIIEQDVLNANFLRKDVKWDFDIYLNDEKKLELKRTLTYNLKNITTQDKEEIFKISSNYNIHSKTEIIECKHKKKGEHDYQNMPFKNTHTDSTLEAEETVLIPANSEIQVVMVFKEIFSNKYIYESHSTRFPIVGLNITINYPEDYEFEIIVQTFSNKLEEITSTKGKKIYGTKEAIYKGQGLEFLCYKKDDGEPCTELS